MIATYNRQHALFRCLTALADQDFLFEDFEVVVVDDASDDATVETLHRMEMPFKLQTVVQSENRGQTAAMNEGARLAEGQILLFLDDDLNFDCSLLSFHWVAHAERSARRVILGKIAPEEEANASYSSKVMYNQLKQGALRSTRDADPRLPQDISVTPNSSLPREIFWTHGGFDEIRFPRRWEDKDLGLRLWKAGIEFQFESRAVVWHSWVKPSGQTDRDWEEDGAAVVTLHELHPELRNAPFPFARLFAGPAWKRGIVRLLASAPTLTKHSFVPVIALLERMPNNSRLHLAGRQLMMTRRAFIALLGARRRAGSWSRLMEIFGPRQPSPHHKVHLPEDRHPAKRSLLG